MPANVRSRSVVVACAVAAITVTLTCGALGDESLQPSVPGMVRQTEIRIAPDIIGRLATIAVEPGELVHRGDLLATLDNPELAAAVGEAKSAATSAKAERDRVYSGVRKEEVDIANQAVLTAEANLVLAQQQYDRASKLAGKDFASKQQLDESTASLAKAQADLELKRAEATEASAGPTAEERAVADARVALAEATLAELQARLDKTVLTAPVDGTIGIRVAEPGEVIGPGKPVMTLDAAGQPWFAFTLREDSLNSLAIGATIALSGQGGQKIDARVTELRPLGEFATWRAARAVGDHDLNAFRVRLEPTGGTDGLEAGMTVWLAEQR